MDESEASAKTVISLQVILHARRLCHGVRSAPDSIDRLLHKSATETKCCVRRQGNLIASRTLKTASGVCRAAQGQDGESYRRIDKLGYPRKGRVHMSQPDGDDEGQRDGTVSLLRSKYGRHAVPMYAVRECLSIELGLHLSPGMSC